jgi:hypothetical protein
MKTYGAATGHWRNDERGCRPAAPRRLHMSHCHAAVCHTPPALAPAAACAAAAPSPPRCRAAPAASPAARPLRPAHQHLPFHFLPPSSGAIVNQSVSDSLFIWMYLISAWSSCEAVMKGMAKRGGRGGRRQQKRSSRGWAGGGRNAPVVKGRMLPHEMFARSSIMAVVFCDGERGGVCTHFQPRSGGACSASCDRLRPPQAMAPLPPLMPAQSQPTAALGP